MTMKTKILCMCVLIVALAMALPSPHASAAPVTVETLLNRPFDIEMDGTVYTLTFFMGPFGPGVNGAAVLSWDGTEATFAFRGYDSGKIEITGLCTLYFSGDEIVLVNPAWLVFRARDKPDEAAVACMGTAE
jgi:hypothetical protein